MSFVILDNIPLQMYNIKGVAEIKMIKHIYHGSDHIIYHPAFGEGKPYNDYGRGFYCTESPDLAKEWGVKAESDGYANHYEIETDGLTILELTRPQYTILHWLSVLLENREFDETGGLAERGKKYILDTFSVDYRNYDCIIGYRADDSYFTFAQNFLNGAISYKQLSRAMYLGKLGLQFVLKSARSFEQLFFIDYEIAKTATWYKKKIFRDVSAREEYNSIVRKDIDRSDLFITNFIFERILPDDPRLR